MGVICTKWDYVWQERRWDEAQASTAQSVGEGEGS